MAIPPRMYWISLEIRMYVLSSDRLPTYSVIQVYLELLLPQPAPQAGRSNIVTATMSISSISTEVLYFENAYMINIKELFIL